MSNLKILLWGVLMLFSCFTSGQSSLQGTLLREQSLNNVPCNPNTFWGIYPSSNPGVFTIGEYEIISGTLVSTGVKYYNAPNASLAYSTNGSPNNLGTFFNVDFGLSGNILKYNNNSWASIINNSIFQLRNCAGHDSILVFDGLNNSFFPKEILVFSGNNLIPIYNCGNNISKVVEDLAVDESNNIWFFTSYDTLYTELSYLTVIDKSGVLLNSYPIDTSIHINFLNTYGMFILNNTLYLGIGAMNPNYPNSLLPFHLINDTAYIGTPITCTANFSDLESCNQGTLTSISEVPESLKELSVYPNPARDQFMLHLPYSTSPEATVQVFNLQGEIIYAQKAGEQSPINCSSWPRGVYFVSLLEKGKARITKKVVVM